MKWLRRRGRRDEGGGMVQVPDRWAVGYDGSPLRLHRSPEVRALLTAPAIEAPFTLSDPDTREYWDGFGRDGQLRAVACAYLTHPVDDVRRETLALVRELGVELGSHPQELCDILAYDAAPGLRDAAAALVWERDLLGFGARVLRDEWFAATDLGAVGHGYDALAGAAPAGREGDLLDAVAEAFAFDGHDDRELIAAFAELLRLRARGGEEARRLGETIARSGHMAMLRAHDAVALVRGRVAARTLEHGWDGIGAWRG